jgi:hypothetical protein
MYPNIRVQTTSIPAPDSGSGQIGGDKFSFTILRGGTTLSQGIPIHRVINNQGTIHDGGCHEDSCDFALPGNLGVFFQRYASRSSGRSSAKGLDKAGEVAGARRQNR